VVVSPKGTVTFRYDHRLTDRRQTLTLGQYDEFQVSQLTRNVRDIRYGGPLSLSEARELLAHQELCCLRSGLSC
jgi:hypothetical protein